MRRVNLRRQPASKKPTWKFNLKLVSLAEAKRAALIGIDIKRLSYC
jgi:type VI protein secretion system component VasK